MATWWEIAFTGKPTDADLENVAELIKQGFTRGPLIEEPDEQPVTFAHEGTVAGVEYVTVLGGGGDPLEYNIAREQAEQCYPNHGS